MPELPEVETIACGLRRSVVGATIDRVDVRRADVVRHGGGRALRRLAGRTIRHISRRGKYLLIDLGGPTLVIHLGMTGQVWVEASGTPIEKHTHVVFHLADGRHLRHRDARRFGFMEVVPPGRRPECLDDLGPEPLDLTAEQVGELLAAHNRQMKPLLMDQRVVAGIGNIYADEILFRARVHPLTKSGRLGPRKARALCAAVHETLTEAITNNGTSIRDYVTGAGVPGNFQVHLRVYGRAGEPCTRCGRRIAHTRVGQRSTYFCPTCQRNVV